MSKLKEIFTLITKLNTLCNEGSIMYLYEEMVNSLDKLADENNQLKTINYELSSLLKEREPLEKELKMVKEKLQDKEEEVLSFKKNSLISSMDKQITEHKNYIGVLEKQLQFYKTKSETNSMVDEKEATCPIEEIIQSIDIQEATIEPEEYETYEHSNKKYYKIKKKLYKIKKNGELGDYYGKIKNGEIIKE
jgi:hypothetical protein